MNIEFRKWNLSWKTYIWFFCKQFRNIYSFCLTDILLYFYEFVFSSEAEPQFGDVS
jgi:hypothetical protein